MSTNLVISNKSVFIELSELNGSCFQLITDANGIESTYVKVEIPIDEWNNILKKWEQRKNAPKIKEKPIYSVDL
jgi:hypothetical protein